MPRRGTRTGARQFSWARRRNVRRPLALSIPSFLLLPPAVPPAGGVARPPGSLDGLLQRIDQLLPGLIVIVYFTQGHAGVRISEDWFVELAGAIIVALGELKIALLRGFRFSTEHARGEHFRLRAKSISIGFLFHLPRPRLET